MRRPLQMFFKFSMYVLQFVRIQLGRHEYWKCIFSLVSRLFDIDSPLRVRPALAPRHIDELEDLVVLLHPARPQNVLLFLKCFSFCVLFEFFTFYATLLLCTATSDGRNVKLFRDATLRNIFYR